MDKFSCFNGELGESCSVACVLLFIARFFCRLSLILVVFLETAEIYECVGGHWRQKVVCGYVKQVMHDVYLIC